jgi:hypothetical protein
MSATRLLVGAALRLAAGALALVALGALLVAALGVGPWARDQLAFRFAEPARRPGAAFDVAAANARLAAAALLSAWAVRHRPGLRAALDPVLGLVAAANLALLAVALGAYGRPLLESVALHGPLELAAFAVCAAAYLAARQQELDRNALVGAGAAAFALLAAAAIVETHLQLGAAR